MSAGQTIPFTLIYAPSPEPIDPLLALEQTEAFWTEWSARCSGVLPFGENALWSEAVTRSLITLKALTHAPTGGLVAAATTSLPEKLGGARN